MPKTAPQHLPVSAGASEPATDQLPPGLLQRSRQALQEAYASQALAEHSMETALGELVTGAPVTCPPATPLRVALAEMQRRRIGSMLVADGEGRPVGIFTRFDVLGRVALAGLPLSTPIGEVMVQPVHCLTVGHTAQDAALLMSRHGFRHVPVTRDGAVVGMLSERDLFAMQRMSLKQVSSGIRGAGSVDELKHAASEIRQLAAVLLAQGVQARQLTSLISHLNDVLTLRLLEIEAPAHGVDLSRVCWLALGSEGRSEQTIATDQDNALILQDGTDADARRRALALGRAVNLALDACGYPLCKGGIMAGEPSCCLTLAEWHARFDHWIGHGAPRDLLNACIYFDLRPLAGDGTLADALSASVLAAARRTPRFLKQMALNALERGPPLGWLGGVAMNADGSIDLKVQGSALFVEAARVYSLAWGVPATGTRERLEGAGRAMGLAQGEYEAWIVGFEFLQMLRLRLQLEGRPDVDKPNRKQISQLNDIDRRILTECLRFARLLQQRLQLDYQR